MTVRLTVPSDPDLRGVPDALRRAAEKARRLAEQSGTPFVTRQPGVQDQINDTCGADGGLQRPAKTK
jgi:hypothetical protein